MSRKSSGLNGRLMAVIRPIALAVGMDHRKDALAAAFIFENHIGRRVGEDSGARTSDCCRRSGSPLMGLAEKQWEQAEQGGFARCVFAGQAVCPVKSISTVYLERRSRSGLALSEKIRDVVASFRREGWRFNVSRNHDVIQVIP